MEAELGGEGEAERINGGAKAARFGMGEAIGSGGLDWGGMYDEEAGEVN